ncbi:tRNA methyltransferase 10 homolog C [Brachionichthys hirsutus]|uniref:tRNA methyltransferase 10 homolog C n=1 Tax=Brachionichthys hirsutus TaxID=412623 RepID=UPI003604A78B
MLRLLATEGLQGLLKCRHLTPSCVTKGTAARVLLNGIAPRRLRFPTRPFCTARPTWKDAEQPKRDGSEDAQTVDLDKWKSVMRAEIAEHQQGVNEGNEEEEEDDSLLSETRNKVNMMREAGTFVPQEMTDQQVHELSKLTTKTSRKRYLKFLALKERYKMADRAKKERKRAEMAAVVKEPSTEEEHPRNAFLMRPPMPSWEKLTLWRCAQAMMFGQPLVFDMSYETKMNRRELENAVSQMMEAEGWNRRASEPFHLHYCSLQPDGGFQETFVKRYKAEHWDRLLVTATDREPLDVFPLEQLVYLTADSPNVLHKFDHSKVYIIGALVDFSIQPGVSLSNAKRRQIATARLPLDRYLQWGCGSKNMTLDQMMRIMCAVKETGSWTEALKFVPTRKHEARVEGIPARSAKDGRRFAGKHLDPSHEQPGIAGNKRKWSPSSFPSSVEGRRTGERKVWWEEE